MDNTKPITVETPSEEELDRDPNYVGMYTFYDRKAKRYQTPFFAISDLFAKRHYSQLRETEGLIKSFPKDFDLIRIGYFNNEFAYLDPYDQTLINGKSHNDSSLTGDK